MGGWEPASLVLLVGMGVLCAGLLAVHYAPRLACWVSGWWTRNVSACRCQRCRAARAGRLAQVVDIEAARRRHPSARQAGGAR